MWINCRKNTICNHKRVCIAAHCLDCSLELPKLQIDYTVCNFLYVFALYSIFAIFLYVYIVKNVCFESEFQVQRQGQWIYRVFYIQQHFPIFQVAQCGITICKFCVQCMLRPDMWTEWCFCLKKNFQRNAPLYEPSQPNAHTNTFSSADRVSVLFQMNPFMRKIFGEIQLECT